MSLDYKQQVTLGLMAGTMAQFLQANPQEPGLDEHGLADADEWGMHALATGFLRMYHELLKHGLVDKLEDLKTPTKETH